MRHLTLALPVALALGLVACDSRDYEAEITELQGQLEQAQAELEAQRTENQTLAGEMEELRAQAEQPADAAMAGGAGDAVRVQLETARERAAQTADQLAALQAQPDAAAIAILRTGAEQIVVAIEAAASELGIELQQAAISDGEGEAQPGGAQESQARQPEPAAGPEGEQEPQSE